MDPFVDKPRSDKGKKKGKEKKKDLFMKPKGPSRLVLGQLTAYAASILSARYHTHTFMVFIMKDYMRLIRP